MAKTTQTEKWMFTLYTVVILLVVMNPMTYQFTNGFLSGILGKISSETGCPTWVGFGVHAVVFAGILRGLMELN